MDVSADLETLLAAFCAGPSLLRVAIAGLDDAGLDQALDDQTWSIRQYVHHVVDGDDLWQMGLLAALGDAVDFEFQWYWSHSQDGWAEAWCYSERPVEPSLEFFAANRQRSAQILRVIPNALQHHMSVRWPGRAAQPLSVRDILEMQTRHVTGHIADIQRIRTERGA